MDQRKKYYLCVACAEKRDWENDPHVKTMIALELAKPAEERHRCCFCGKPMANIFFKLHSGCAKQEQQCQCCTKLMKPEEKPARDEAYETFLDFFTLLVKSYGMSKARQLAQASSIWEDNPKIILQLKDITIAQLDSRAESPLWTQVLAGRVMRVRYCASCFPFSPYPPAIGRAAQCGHLVVGSFAEWCALCAAGRVVCEICGVSVK